MKNYALLIILLVFVGSAEAKKPKAPAQPPTLHPLSQREVDEMRNRVANNSDKVILQQEGWKAGLELECPVGGRENVIIGGELGKHAFRVSGSRTARYLLARQMAVVTFINNNNVTNITSGSRTYVRNMCPQGKIALVALLPADAGMFVGVSPTYQNSYFVATWNEGGRTFRKESQTISLYTYSYQRETQYTWDINQ